MQSAVNDQLYHSVEAELYKIGIWLLFECYYRNIQIIIYFRIIFKHFFLSRGCCLRSTLDAEREGGVFFWPTSYQ